MSLIMGWATNQGIIRDNNQDCCYTAVNDSVSDSIGIAVICDGMGGLSQGEYASSLTCEYIADWFNRNYNCKKAIRKKNDIQILDEIEKVIIKANDSLVTYGKFNGCRIGTTASVILFINSTYYVIHIGDSRIYHYSSNLLQITEDDSLIAKKLRNGEITELEYSQSNQKNILTQCVGVNSQIYVHKYFGRYKSGDVFFLCSDGMYHFFDSLELTDFMISQHKEKGQNITASIERMIDKLISRGETDNLTGVIVYVS